MTNLVLPEPFVLALLVDFVTNHYEDYIGFEIMESQFQELMENTEVPPYLQAVLSNIFQQAVDDVEKLIASVTEDEVL